MIRFGGGLNVYKDLLAGSAVDGYIPVFAGSVPAEPAYVMIVHLDYARDLRTITARDKWTAAHQAWRMDGKPDISPQQILTHYKAPAIKGETGAMDGIRFIKTGESKIFTV